MLGDLKPKKKRKRRKSKIPPKPRSAIDVARNPLPYQFNMYTPPFPAVINHQPKANSNAQNVSDTFRNIRAVNAKELERLRGDLTAYRQEAQTIFKKLVAFPRENVYYEPVPAVTEPEEEMVSAVEENEPTDAEEENEATDAEDINIGVDKNRMIEENEAMRAEDINLDDVDESFMPGGSRSVIQKTPTSLRLKIRSPNKNKTKNQLREALENLPGDEAYIMSNTQFTKTKALEMRALAKARGIELTL